MSGSLNPAYVDCINLEPYRWIGRTPRSLLLWLAIFPHLQKISYVTSLETTGIGSE